MTRHSILAASFVLVLAIVSAAHAADAPANNKSGKGAEPAKPAIEVIAVTIHPVAEPKPALKYHLLPTFLESTPGDAVPLYAKALVRRMEIWKDMQNEAGERSHDKSPAISSILRTGLKRRSKNCRAIGCENSLNRLAG